MFRNRIGRNFIYGEQFTNCNSPHSGMEKTRLECQMTYTTSIVTIRLLDWTNFWVIFVWFMFWFSVDKISSYLHIVICSKWHSIAFQIFHTFQCMKSVFQFLMLLFDFASWSTENEIIVFCVPIILHLFNVIQLACIYNDTMVMIVRLHEYLFAFQTIWLWLDDKLEWTNAKYLY